jgi:predicted site-specific integrase-resolvase
MTKTYSNKQAAKKAKIHPITLHHWLAAGKIRPSIAVKMNGSTLWRWTQADLARLLKYKAAHYRKGRDRKKKSKT